MICQPNFRMFLLTVVNVLFCIELCNNELLKTEELRDNPVTNVSKIFNRINDTKTLDKNISNTSEKSTGAKTSTIFSEGGSSKIENDSTSIPSLPMNSLNGLPADPYSFIETASEDKKAHKGRKGVKLKEESNTDEVTTNHFAFDLESIESSTVPIKNTILHTSTIQVNASVNSTYAPTGDKNKTAGKEQTLVSNASVTSKPNYNIETKESSDVIVSPKSKPEFTRDDNDTDSHFSYSLAYSDSDYVIPIVATIFAVPLIIVLAMFLYKRSKEFWERRHYRRMDFLIDGMYND